MKLHDEQAIKLLKKLRPSEVLLETIDEYPDDERDGRSDLEFLMDEISYYYSLHMEDGHCYHDDYEDAKRKLRETKHGKSIPVDIRTMRPMPGYWPSDIEACKNVVNEVARIQRLGKKLQGMGYYGSWWTF